MSSAVSTIRKPVIDHLKELQMRALWSILAVFVGGIAGYSLNNQILDVIQKPLNQTLYYTAPTGGLSFVIKTSLTFGLIVALPVIIYHLIRFMSPVLTSFRKMDLIIYVIWSVNLAYIGTLFAYTISLPAALHFLTNFGSQNIQAIISADEYFNFALAYIGGFALLFQLPLIVLFINRIKPLSPKGMMSAQRYVILGSFIAAAILTPTPDPLNQIIMAVPPIILYQLSVLIVWILNKKSNKSNFEATKMKHSNNFGNRPIRDNAVQISDTVSRVQDQHPKRSGRQRLIVDIIPPKVF